MSDGTGLRQVYQSVKDSAKYSAKYAATTLNNLSANTRTEPGDYIEEYFQEPNEIDVSDFEHIDAVDIGDALKDSEGYNRFEERGLTLWHDGYAGTNRVELRAVAGENILLYNDRELDQEDIDRALSKQASRLENEIDELTNQKDDMDSVRNKLD